jgi:hypothetical protein
MALREAAATSARVTLRSTIVLLNVRGRRLCLGAGFGFSLTHRQSVVRPEMRVRGNGAAFADNFLNDYSDVKNITYASKHYHCSGFRPRRFALR